MDKGLLKEVLLYGNLEIVYSLRDIKKIEIEDFCNFLEEFDIYNEGIYRFFLNYKSFVSVNEIELIKEYTPNSNKLILILEKIISKARQDVFKNINIEVNTYDYNSIIKTFVYNLLFFLLKKIDSHNNLQLKNHFEQSFSRFKNKYKTEYLIINHVEPFDDNNYWKPSWKIIYKNVDYFLEGIDTFTDIIFSKPLIVYTDRMIREIKNINKRIVFLKTKAVNYYNNYIRGNIPELSKNIFENFPLQIVYNDYYDCLKKHDFFYKPEILRYLELKDFNRDIYILSILPLTLTAYLLGYPVITNNVPTWKNISERLKNFKPGYYEKLSTDVNKKYIDIMSMDISCGNGTDEYKDYTDIFGNRIIDYNIIDIFPIYNGGGFFLFTCSEFKELIKKNQNFYNRGELKITDNIVLNVRFKKKQKDYLKNRKINAELNFTLKENYEEIKEAIRKEEIEVDQIVETRGLRFNNNNSFLNNYYWNYTH
jgi:hypothetical protein